jgi:hypothetical protein
MHTPQEARNTYPKDIEENLQPILKDYLHLLLVEVVPE